MWGIGYGACSAGDRYKSIWCTQDRPNEDAENFMLERWAFSPEWFS